METIFINNNTNTVIANNHIVSSGPDGIVVNNSNCWQFIPTDNISVENTYSEYYPQEALPKLELKTPQELLKKSDTTLHYTENLSYEFGLDNFIVCTRIPQSASGLISNEINVDNVSYLEIEANVTNEEHGSVEFYIIDGSNEIPILPANIRCIVREKLFYGLDTRFLIDTAQGKPPVLYEDNVVSTKDYAALNSEDFYNHTYTITYTPVKDKVRYAPVFSNIQIKIIIRQYDEIPVSIERIILHKFGGSAAWISKQSV